MARTNNNPQFKQSVLIWFYLVLLLPFTSCKSQSFVSNQDSHSSELSQVSYAQVEVDAFGNIYLLTTKNVLQKFNEDRELQFEYSFNRQGKISRIDVSNPQKILVYLPQYQNIVFLDNTLSVIKTLNLEQLGYWAINSVAVSNDNLIWIYDPTIHQLIKINDDGRKVLESNELFDSQMDDSRIDRIMVDKEKVFLATDAHIFCYTQFAQYDKVMPLINTKIQLFNKQLLFLTENTIKRQSLGVEYLFDESDVIHTSEKSIIDFKLGKEGKLYLLEKNELTVIQL